MSFTKQKHASFAKELTLSELEFNEFAKRLAGYFGGEVTPARVKDAFFILKQIKDTRLKSLKEKHYIWGMKNTKFIKYGWKIEELYLNEEVGYLTISNRLWEEHRVNIGKSQISRFIKKNGITRG